MSKSIDGIKDLARAFDGLGKRLVNKTIRTAMRDGAKVFAAEERSEAPVLTGETKRSIKVRAGKRKKDTITVMATASTPYILSTEYGNEDQDPNAFIARAFDKVEEQVRQQILDNIAADIHW